MHNKPTNILLRYHSYSNILEEYLNLEEFRSLSPLTISSKRLTITSLMNYLGDNDVKDFQHCLQKNVTGYLSSLTGLSSSTISGRKFILRHFLFTQHVCRAIGPKGLPPNQREGNHKARALPATVRSGGSRRGELEHSESDRI